MAGPSFYFGGTGFPLAPLFLVWFCFPFLLFSGPVTDEEMREYLKRVEADLLWILSQSEVELKDQYGLAQLGYLTVSKFARLEDSRAEARKALSADLAIDPSEAAPAGPRNRVRLAALVAAWDSARNQAHRQDELKAEAKALNVTRPVGVTERVAMRRALEVKCGKMPPHETPSSEYLAAKMEEVENGEPTASALGEITSAEHVEEKSMEAKLDTSGGIRIISKRGKVNMPRDSEEFRLRLRIECNMWMMLSTKFTNISYLQGLEKDAFVTYTDYFLGRSCAQMEISQADGTPLSSMPIPWKAVLAYEFSCRRSALRQVREEGAVLNTALLESIKNAETKEVNFTSPIALGLYRESSSKRMHDGAEQSTQVPKVQKGKGKGKKNTKVAGKAAKGGQDRQQNSRRSFLSYTPDGRQICFKFNNKLGCASADCDRVHMCQVKGCGESTHGAVDCPKRKSG